MIQTDYAVVFGDDPRRPFRMRQLAELVGFTLTEVPRFRDAWIEFHQAEFAAENVGHLEVVLYTQSNGDFRDSAASKIFGLRTSPLYREEFDETVATTYTAFHFSLPPDTPQNVLATMRGAATEPVDTDARWRRVLDLPERNHP
jgi:hypothetical protein